MLIAPNESTSPTPTPTQGPLRKLAGELVRFLVVGLSAVATDFLVYFALVRLWPALPPNLAKGISFVTGALLSFVLNRSFVFRAKGQVRAQAPRFVILYGLTLALNTATHSLVFAHYQNHFLSWFLATAASTLGNYLGMKFAVFATPRSQA